MPSLIWTPSEQCAINFGPDYVAFKSQTYDCANLRCFSLSDRNADVVFTPDNGTICDSGAVNIHFFFQYSASIDRDCAKGGHKVF